MQCIVANRGVLPAAPCNITVEVVAALATVKGSVSEKPSELVELGLAGLAVSEGSECQDPDST